MAVAASVQSTDAASLTDAILLLARQHGCAMSKAELLSGLPLAKSGLTIALIERAAARVGLVARVTRRPIHNIGSHMLPAVLLLKDGSAVLLARLRAETGEAELLLPGMPGASERLRLDDLERMYSGTVVLAKPRQRQRSVGGCEANTATHGDTREHWFRGAIARLRGIYLQVVLAAALTNILALAFPLFSMNVYDRVLPNKAVTTLWVLTAGVILALGFDLLLRSLRSSLVGIAGRRADTILASRVFERVMKVDLKQRPQRTGDFANQLRDFEFMRDFFTSQSLVTLIDTVFVGIFLAIIAAIGGWLVFVPLAGIVLCLFVAMAIQIPLRRVVSEDKACGVRRYSLLFESILGLETIKSASAESEVQRKWEDAVAQNAATTERLRNLSAISMNVTSFVQQTVSVGIVLLGYYRFAEGQMSMGAIIACVMLASRAVGPLAGLMSMAARAQQAMQAYRGIDAIMRLEQEAPAGQRFTDCPIKHGEITLDRVSLRYPDASRPSLDQVTLHIAPGERVGIIGRVGSGKTTLGRMLARLVTPTEGKVLIDGLEMGQYHPAEIRRSVAFVGQDATLFHGSVRENLALGHIGIDDTRLHAAAEIAGVMDFLRTHPKGLDMPVGEAGRLLSQGQRHALLLARAFVGDPCVVFLDEPTGNLDRQTEQVLVQRLQQAIRPDQTLIVTTHRSAAFALVDRLIVIDDGRIVADGPKAAILASLAPARPQTTRPKQVVRSSGVMQAAV